MTTSRQRAARAGELSFSMAMTRARYANAVEKDRARSARARARLDALRPLLAAAGYGPHGGAERLRAEARAVRAASRSAGGTEHTGPGCRICAEGRRMDAVRGRGEGIATGYREIAR